MENIDHRKQMDMLLTILCIPQEKITEAGRMVQVFYPKRMVKQIECRKERLRNTFSVSEN